MDILQAKWRKIKVGKRERYFKKEEAMVHKNRTAQLLSSQRPYTWVIPVGATCCTTCTSTSHRALYFCMACSPSQSHPLLSIPVPCKDPRLQLVQ